MARNLLGEVESILRARRWTTAQAAAVLEKAEASGLSLGEFAARHGVEPQRLYRWRRRLGPGGEPVRFEEVVVPRPTREPSQANADLELVLRSGHVVRLGAAFDTDALRRLLSVLEPC